MPGRSQTLGGPADRGGAGGGAVTATGQFGRKGDASAAGRWARPLFDLLVPIAGRVFLGPLRVHHRERFPRRGAVLVVANHPATWMDALVLRMALGRWPHFLVHGTLYRPAARGWFLRFYGALPIHHKTDSAAAAALNLETERACHRLFERGEVVVTFPEGISRSDWHLEPFHHGAARLAMGCATNPDGRPALALVVVGIHYRDRVAFRGEVEVSIATPIDLVPFVRAAASDPRAAERALTARLFAELERMVVHTSNAAVEALAKELLPMVALEERAARAAHPGSLETARSIASLLDRWRREQTGRWFDLRRRVSGYRRVLGRLRLSDRVLREGPPRDAGGRLRALALVAGLVPAFVGWAFHWAPAALTRRLAHDFAVEPSRVAFSRLVAGVVIFPATYLLAGGVIWRLTGLPHSRVAAILFVAAALGLASIILRRWLAETRQRFRLARLERGHPRLVARARAARADVIARLASARSEAGP